MTAARLMIAALGLVAVACSAERERKAPRVTAPRCDNAALRTAVTTLQATPENVAARAEAVDRLAAACPGLPSALRHTLTSAYVDAAHPVDAEALRAHDREYLAVHGRLCKDSVAWARGASSVEPEERAHAMFTTCGLAAFGLLEDDESFRATDIDAFLLYQWLVDGAVEAELARQFVRCFLQTRTD